jgi:hypothetical protein
MMISGAIGLGLPFSGQHSGGPPPPPPTGDHLTTEDGDLLTTEDSDVLDWE